MQTEKEYITERSVLGLHSESVGEYPLPDYNGDVKRVLMISPRVVPNGQYMNESNLEFSGNVFYDVIYLDSENNIARAEFSTDYELALKQDGECYRDADIRTSIASYNVRLVGPRKFSAKAALSSDVRISESRVLEIQGDAMDDESVETLSGDAHIITSFFFCGESVELKEDVVFIDGAIEDEVQVLSCDVCAGKVITLCDDGVGEVKCDLVAKIVYRNAYEPICTKTVNFPYSAQLESSDLDNCTSLFGTVNVSEIKVELVPGEDGVGVLVCLNVTPSLRGVKNDSIEVVRDVYLKDRGTSCEYRDFTYTEHICSASAEGAFSTKIPLSDLTDARVCEIISSDCVVSREGCEITQNGALVKGEIRFNAFARAEDDENAVEYMNLKFALPFEQNVNLDCQIHDNMHAEAYVEAYGEKAEVSDNYILASSNLYSQICVNAQRKMRCLGASYLTDEEFSSEESVVTVYYPDANESVFDIAKRFHTSVRKISEDNSLSESVFNAKDAPVSSMGYKKLLIK